jgi:hypothetical protein
MPNRAIVVGISSYPALGAGGKSANDLPGAVADANAMAEWLAGPGQATVTKITSTGLDDQPWQTVEIKPSRDDLEHPFDQIVIDNQRVGDRLTIYCAGHGIAPTIASRCLLLPRAVASNPPILPNFDGSAWLEWFSRQTHFDEFVLWMDVCGTAAIEYARGEPSYGKNIQQRADLASAKVFMAYPSGMGRDAYEGTNDNGIVRGFFTEQLLSGLNGAAADGNGEVRSGSLANYLRNGSSRQSDGTSTTRPDRPPPQIPVESDMLFATQPLPVYAIQVERIAGGVPPEGSVVTVEKPNNAFVRNVNVAGGWIEVALPVGIFKLSGDGIRDRLFEVGAQTPRRIGL